MVQLLLNGKTQECPLAARGAIPRELRSQARFPQMLYIELGVVITLICINGLLAMAELAVISSRRTRLQGLVDREVPGSTKGYGTCI